MQSKWLVIHKTKSIGEIKVANCKSSFFEQSKLMGESKISADNESIGSSMALHLHA